MDKKIIKLIGAAFLAIVLSFGAGNYAAYAAEVTDPMTALALQQAALAAMQQKQAAALQQTAAQSSTANVSAAAKEAQKQAAAAQEAAKQQEVVDAGNYIDVNKTTQTLSLVNGGQITYVTPIVTGNVRLGHTTPNGVYNVYAKQTNRVLKGDNYESFVKYWMPFYKGYGIHDANWRTAAEFGGTTYQTSGSHGCVNIPPENMPTLFAAVSVGTPVIVHD